VPKIEFYADSTSSELFVSNVSVATGTGIPSEFYDAFGGDRAVGILSQRSSASSGVGASEFGYYVGPPTTAPRVQVTLTYLPLENYNR
jgi:hypothetical protein